MPLICTFQKLSHLVKKGPQTEKNVFIDDIVSGKLNCQIDESEKMLIVVLFCALFKSACRCDTRGELCICPIEIEHPERIGIVRDYS